MNFRVTDEEFSRLKAASEDDGARSLSDYARLTLMRALDGTSGPKQNALNGRDELLALTLRMGNVELGLARLERRFLSLTGDTEAFAAMTGV